MARISSDAAAKVYAAAEVWRDRCLFADGSLFDPGRAVWTPANVASFKDRLDNREEGAASFEDKLRKQLADASDEVRLLAAELLFVHLSVVLRQTGTARKTELVELPLGVMDIPVELPTQFRDALTAGLLRPGQAYNNYRPNQLRFLLGAVLHIKEVPQERRLVIATDPWAFRDEIFALPVFAAQSQRECLLHLVYPDIFEPMASQADKARIAERFAEHVSTKEGNVDLRLQEIRRVLEHRYTSDDNNLFYFPPVRRMWEPSGDAWDGFVHWAAKFLTFPKFDEWERTYKLALAQELASARGSLFAGDVDWAEKSIAVVRSRQNNLISWRYHEAFTNWLRDPAGGGTRAVKALWDSARSVEERFEAFNAELPSTVIPGAGTRVNCASVLHMAMGAEQFPVFRSEPFAKAYRITGTEPPPNEAGVEEVYALALAFLDRFIEEASVRGVTIQDRLEAQSLLFAITSWSETEEPIQALTRSDRRKFAKFRGDPVAQEDPDGEPSPQGTDVVLVGALGESVTKFIDKYASVLERSGKAAVWWSHGVRAEFQDRLNAGPFPLYLYQRGGEIPAVARVSEFSTSATSAGIACPWPEFALPEEVEAVNAGAAKSVQFRTWLLIESMEILPEPLHLSDFERAEDGGAAVPQAMLSSFLYAKRQEAHEPASPTPFERSDPWELLAKSTYQDLPAVLVNRTLLSERKQLIFQGPPGTGKTYFAQLFAEVFAGNRDNVHLVQFHPSYAYEDFVEGLKPTLTSEGVLTYSVDPGSLRIIAEVAEDHPDEKYVLIIDEMNRANLPKVFGELFFLLEYRNREVTLPYSKESFSLPKNLYFIGTMNTADRSIALVDFALRRRFGFVGFYPSANHGMLRSYLSQHAPGMSFLADMLSAVNDEMGMANRDYHLGHSYFMVEDPGLLTPDYAERVWKHSIEPHLEEFWYEDSGRADKFRYGPLRARIAAAGATPASPTVELDSGDEQAT